MTRVVVTGGSGKLGRATIYDLVENGYEVVNLDLAPPPDPQARFIRVDLTDYGQVIEALLGVDAAYDGVDALVHLAAIPGPGQATNPRTYANNVLSTFNVFSAATRAGVENIVWASSETLLGLPFDVPPPYVPIDEQVPRSPETAYALGKLIDEVVAEQFCRRHPELKLIGLRFSNIREPAEFGELAQVHRDPRLQTWNMWSYIDVRDGAQAVRRALEYPVRGFDVFIIASPDTIMTQSSAELLAAYFPQVALRRELGTHESLLSSDKAKRLLGFAPRYSWRDGEAG